MGGKDRERQRGRREEEKRLRSACLSRGKRVKGKRREAGREGGREEGREGEREGKH